MKYLCPSCERMVELQAFRVEGACLVLTCGRCGAEGRSEPLSLAAASGAPPGLRVKAPPAPAPSPKAEEPKAGLRVVALRGPEAAKAAAEAAQSVDPLAAPAGRCPKCIAQRVPQETSCRHCGLSFAGADPRSFAPAADLAQRWTALLAQWDRTEAHDALLAQAALFGELPAVGRLYRIRLAQVTDDPYAQRGRDEVLRLASLPSLSSRVAEPATKTLASSAWRVLALLVVIALAVGLLISSLARLSPRAGP